VIILSSDVGSRNWGFCVAKYLNDSVELLETSSWYLKEPKIGDRMTFLEKELSLLIEKYQVSNLVFEMPYMTRGSNTHDIYFCTGIIPLLGAKYNLPVTSYTAPEIKKRVTGSGKADKKDIELAVRKFFSLPDDFTFKSDHSSDSVAIGMCYNSYSKFHPGAN
jgi:crossover junction endodeoxyribonuclease RuvC